METQDSPPVEFAGWFSVLFFPFFLDKGGAERWHAPDWSAIQGIAADPPVVRVPSRRGKEEIPVWEPAGGADGRIRKLCSHLVPTLQENFGVPAASGGEPHRPTDGNKVETGPVMVHDVPHRLRELIAGGRDRFLQVAMLAQAVAAGVLDENELPEPGRLAVAYVEGLLARVRPGEGALVRGARKPYAFRIYHREVVEELVADAAWGPRIEEAHRRLAEELLAARAGLWEDEAAVSWRRPEDAYAMVAMGHHLLAAGMEPPAEDAGAIVWRVMIRAQQLARELPWTALSLLEVASPLFPRTAARESEGWYRLYGFWHGISASALKAAGDLGGALREGRASEAIHREALQRFGETPQRLLDLAVAHLKAARAQHGPEGPELQRAIDAARELLERTGTPARAALWAHLVLADAAGDPGERRRWLEGALTAGFALADEGGVSPADVTLLADRVHWGHQVSALAADDGRRLAVGPVAGWWLRCKLLAHGLTVEHHVELGNRDLVLLRTARGQLPPGRWAVCAGTLREHLPAIREVEPAFAAALEQVTAGTPESAPGEHEAPK